ncbi:MAG: ABC transporter ATP-binding protein, partial [Jaaginema sp. PMC 1078.18]|nr:ABC transporter ATP-binding protein [Jaaginema sp. PMC 1078.18]
FYGYLSIQITEQVDLKLFNLVMDFSFPCASRYKIGDLLNYINGGGTVQTQISLFNQLITHLLMVIAYTVVILWISPSLSIFAILLSLVLLQLQRYLKPIFIKLSLETTDISVELAKEKTESIQALRLVHTFGQQGYTKSKINRIYKTILPLFKQQVRLGAISNPASNVLIILTIGGLLIGGFSILSASSSRNVLPALITFISAFNRLVVQVQFVLNVFNSLASQTGSMNRLNSILETQDKQFNTSGNIDFEGLAKKIIFDDVSLSYQAEQKLALNRVSFELEKGKVVALVGASGAGKSSIADLLIGLYEPTEGKIYVDEVDLKEYSYESWRSRLGVVSQDTFIFNTNILENIRYGVPEASEQEVIEAAKQAQAHEFISELPLSYDTVVGERGYRLSGGQRQRVALARAILRQPEILILDEATSALDSQSERLVQEALGKFQSDRTALVIAHRLSTIVRADKIIVLDKGRIVEVGHHQDLLKLNGVYSKYWNLQSQGSQTAA